MTSERNPIWGGPYAAGITQSLMGKWLNCPHRFWLYAICGIVEDQGTNIPLVYGDAFHNALETYSLGRTTPEKAGERIKDYFHKLAKTQTKGIHELTKWSRIGYDQFLSYCKVWKTEDSSFTSLLAEQSFEVPYTLPSGRVIKLRGKWDGLIQTGTKTKSTLLFEHKIKGDVDHKNLTDTLAQNAQVLFYLIPLQLYCEDHNLPRPEGVLYNVIQRPLAGRKHSIKQKKGRKVKVKGTDLFETKGAETMDQYYSRLAQLYTKHPEDFFYRWRISISQDEVDRFRKECLDPLLEQMCDWWDSIQGDPFDPWVSKYQDAGFTIHQTANKLHYRRPFGIYDKMAKGLVGDYQDYLITGNKSSLQRITTVFPEL